MEVCVDSVPDVGLDNSKILSFGMLLDDVAKLFDGDARLDVGNSFLETLASGLDETDIVWVGFRAVTYVVGLIEITMITFVEQRDVEVENVSVLQWALIWNAVADDFIHRTAVRLGKVVVVERRRVCLELSVLGS